MPGLEDWWNCSWYWIDVCINPEFKHYVIREFIKLVYGEEYFPGRKQKKKIGQGKEQKGC